MRAAFCAAMVGLAARRSFLFLTGDLGFGALEPLQGVMGRRFINAGVAEQNMIGVAAGAAGMGEQAWTYSIAPFVYARPFEQIRNDVCLHDLDVKLIGNGGGFAYGVMGATHHAIEDYGILCTLPNLRVYVPAFAADVAEIVGQMAADPHPAYLRLGRDEAPSGEAVPAYAPWRLLLAGTRGVLIVVGPVAGGVWALAAGLALADRPEIWVASDLPLRAETLPAAVLDRIADTGAVFVLEEHVAQGGVGQMLGSLLLHAGRPPRLFRTYCAAGYPSGRYGSQSFHRTENGLDPAHVLDDVRRLTS